MSHPTSAAISAAAAAKRPSTAAKRAQQNLAGAGNLFAWNGPTENPPSTSAAPSGRRSGGSGSEPAPLSGASAAAAILIQPGSAGMLLPRAHSPLRPPASVYPSGAPGAVTSSVPPGGAAFEISFDDKSAGSGGAGGPGRREGKQASSSSSSAAVDSYLSQRASDVIHVAAEARTAIEKDHATFQRICVQRVQEIRTVIGIWRGESSGSSSSGGDVVEALRYLQTYAHESIAVDVLHSLSACNDWVNVPSPHATFAAMEFDEDGNEQQQEIECVRVKASGGFPTWDYDGGYASVEWLEYLSPVLESLLKSAFEDYLSVAARATGSALDALRPLFEFVAKEGCSADDLSEPTPPSSAEGEGGDQDTEAVEAYEAAVKRWTAASQAVRAIELLKPVSRALVRVNTHYEGSRPAKLCVTRYATIQQWADATQPLCAAHQSALEEAAAAARKRKGGGKKR